MRAQQRAHQENVMTQRLIPALAFATMGLLAAGSASAQVKTWTFGDTTNPGACTGTYNSYGNVINCTQQPSGTVVDLSARAYSSDNTGSTYRTAAINQQGTGSGFGVYNQTEGLSAGSPNHAADNSTPGVDMLMLQFTAAEILKSVTIGWSGSDGDFQVLRWNGASNASLSTVNTSIIGKTATQLVSGGGWELVTLVNGAGGISTPDVSYSVNAGNLSSSYWLVSAYNSSFGGSGATWGTDAIKVLGVTAGLPGQVSAPGTLALAGLGLVGLAFVRRRA
jgi:hypothetical protein